jgi:maleate isomerase
VTAGGSLPLRIGVLTPHAAPGPEVELPEMAGDRVQVVLARVEAASARTGRTAPPGGAAELVALTEPAVLDPVAATLQRGTVDAVAHASTGSGYALGHRAELALAARLTDLCGVPAVTSSAAAVDALRALGAAHVAMVHPPWFDEEVHELGAGYFREQGFDVWPARATGLPLDPERVRARHVVDWVSDHVPDDADAVFLGGNGLRAVGAVQELETRTGRPVVEANQVLLWSLLAATGTTYDVSGWGRLFRQRGPDG